MFKPTLPNLPPQLPRESQNNFHLLTPARLRGARTLTLGFGLACWMVSATVEAQLDLGALVTQSPKTTFPHYRARGTDRVPLLVHVPSSAAAQAQSEGLFRLSEGVYGTYRRASDLPSSISKHPDWKWIWSPPRRLLLDRVIPAIHADAAHANFGRRGANVIIGIVDTGADIRHPDLQTADGRTRIAWYLDLAQSAPFGAHPDLESAYGCSSITSTGDLENACAVFNGADLDKLATSSSFFPIDTIGHGTHVASLAAGNGFSSVPPKYVGVAPDAIYVIVNASRHNQGDLQDNDIILGTKFVFDMAQKMGLPAVVNLSLGGDAGGHDGTSMLEQELSALVGPEFPGRAIVVAGGNSADLYDTTSSYPKPLGIHTSVQVLDDGNTTRLPILVDTSAYPSSDSTFIAWVQSRPGDNLQVGVDTESGECISPISRGGLVDSKRCAGADVSLYNGITNDPNGGSLERPAIALLVTGKFASPSVFSLTFKGAGTVFVWVQSQDGLSPELPTLGALVPSATRERTVAIPATAPELIAVGATLNRTQWFDVVGDKQQLKRFGSISTPVPGDVATFSGAGPNQLDDMKPDILAPGGYVIAAMANLADPRQKYGAGGMFDSTGVCVDNTKTAAQCPDGTNECLCYVADSRHALGVGTSMASPLVAGAIALLFEANPRLTQEQVRHYLQAGAQNLPAGAQVVTLAQEGPGILDVEGALKALASEPASTNPASGGTSWMSFSTGLVHPDDHWPTKGTLHLRDADSVPVSVEPSRIHVIFSPGFLLSPIKAEGYGYYTFDFTAGSGAGRQMMDIEVRVDNRHIVSEQLFIGVDVPSARGEVVGGRGCSVSSAPSSLRFFWGIFGTLAAITVARRRRRLGSVH